MMEPQVAQDWRREVHGSKIISFLPPPFPHSFYSSKCIVFQNMVGIVYCVQVDYSGSLL